MYELKVTSGFAAAHRLTMVGAKCENLHGHNWKVEVVLQGDRLDEGGVLAHRRLRRLRAAAAHRPGRRPRHPRERLGVRRRLRDVHS